MIALATAAAGALRGILSQAPGAGLNLMQARTKIIYHLPRVSEVRRVRKQGYKKRASTEIGRKYIMTRILRGDKIVSQ